MVILVLNCGSSSIKYALYNMTDQSVITSGGIEKIGLEGSFIKFNLPNGEKETIYAEDIEPILGKSAQTLDKEKEDEVATNPTDGVTIAD